MHLKYVQYYGVPDRMASKGYSQWVEAGKETFVHHPWLQLSQKFLGRYMMATSQVALEEEKEEEIVNNSYQIKR